MEKRWYQRLAPLCLILALVVLVVQPFTVVSADTIISDKLIYPEEPVLVEGLSFGIPETDVYWEFPVILEGGDTENYRFYFYSFADLHLYEPEFGQMVDYFRKGYYLGFSDPVPAVSVVGEEGNKATLWFIYDVNEENDVVLWIPIMLIGEAGSYTFPASDSPLIGFDSFTLDLPVDGIAVISAYVGWSGYVGVYDDIQNSVEGGSESMGIVEAITSVWTAVATWFISTMGLVPDLFYTEETGLTFIGTLAIFSGGLAVIIGIIYAVRSWLKSR